MGYIHKQFFNVRCGGLFGVDLTEQATKVQFKRRDDRVSKGCCNCFEVITNETLEGHSRKHILDRCSLLLKGTVQG